MAGALIGVALLNGFTKNIIDKLLTTDTVNLVLGKKLGPDLVQRLTTSLMGAEALVADAELKQFGNPPVRKWLQSLRDAVYRAEDLLESVLIKAEAEEKVPSFGPNRFISNRDTEMVDKMEGVVRRIEDLKELKDFLRLEQISTDSSSWRIPSGSVVKGNVHGREDDKKALINMLNHNNEHHSSVIAIVGIAGVGKTTLAQWLFNNQEEEFLKGFDGKAWVCVSEKFDIVETTRLIKDKLQITCILNDIDSLQCALKEQLSNNKFFIVLDDVWSYDVDKWSKFMTPFQQNGKKGSIVLLTAREEKVTSAVQNCRSFFLNKLSEDDCWSVLADNASFPLSNGSATLAEIGKKIAKKCDGLPLAAETLGSLLRPKHDIEKWNKILTDDIWDFSLEETYNFEKDELISLWMAEDLLPPPKARETLEDVGSECFDELTSRSFFTKIQDKSAYYYYFVMHDLFHDLAIFLSGDFYCNLEKLGENEEIRIQTRHLRVNLHDCSSKPQNSISKLESLRTLLSNKFSKIEIATCDILSKCKYLRVLSSHRLDMLPNSIGELIHLRHLDLSETEIETLPESLCTLSCLQTLKLYGCYKLTTLPIGLCNLVSLRHLDTRRTCLEEMPRKMSKLNQLHILSSFVVGKHGDNGIQELGGLVNLHGSLEIKKLENIADVKEAKGAKMMDKKHLDGLRLEWCSGGDMVSSSQTERDILDNLQPHNHLKELAIDGYKGTIFPDWIGHLSYQYMTEVSLVSCKNCCMLPSLGQLPYLKSLSIGGLDQLKRIGMEFYKSEGDHHSSRIAPFP
ncbi:hypothetical protein PIB30_052062 [Stylosanthes scabra]|uniref:Disease resistance RPP13-like protein 1 n=1 Tax=Stylosanthes scabra TaxID=79078 RepID=A0ABU6WJ45_9FABA|nr:hypothetical protein [Stylosanthes scabra]